MRITDCTLRTRNVVAGVVFCILFAILWTVLAQPVDVSAKSASETIMETGINRADDTMNGTALIFPEGNATLDLNGKSLNVTSVSAKGANLKITGRGSLTVASFVRMPDSILTLAPDEGAEIRTNGVYMKNGTLDVESGTVRFEGYYTHAGVIRIKGGDITADTRADGLRADGSFQMTGGELNAHGRVHGLHAGGDVSVTGGVLTLSGGSGAYYFAHPDRVTLYEGAPVSAGSSAEAAGVMETIAGAEGRAFVQIGDAKSAKAAEATSKEGKTAAEAKSMEAKTAAQEIETTDVAKTEATAQEEKKAAVEETAKEEERTEETAEARAEASTQEDQTAVVEEEVETEEAAGQKEEITDAAKAEASVQEEKKAAAEEAAKEEERTEEAAGAKAEETAKAGAAVQEKEITDVAKAEASGQEEKTTAAVAAEAASAQNDTDRADNSLTTPSTTIPVSAAGSAGAASSSSAASGATGFTAPATADNGMMRRGVILLVAVIMGFFVLKSMEI